MEKRGLSLDTRDDASSEHGQQEAKQRGTPGLNLPWGKELGARLQAHGGKKGQHRSLALDPAVAVRGQFPRKIDTLLPGKPSWQLCSRSRFEEETSLPREERYSSTT